MLDPTKKIPHIQQQGRSPNKMVAGVKSRLESNPVPTRDARRAQTNIVHTRTQRLSQNCVSLPGSCQQWPAAGAGPLGAIDLGIA